MTFEYLISRLKIDKSELDREFIDQAELYFHACRGHALAVKNRDDFYDKKKGLEGSISENARREAVDKNEKAPAESRMPFLIEADSSMVRCRRSLAEAEQAVNEWEGLKDAMNQRGFALRSLADLYASQYYQPSSASPRTRGDYQRPITNQDGKDTETESDLKRR